MTAWRDLNEDIKPIERFEKIDSFINLNRPDPELSKVTTDVWDVLRISFIEHNDTTVFQSDFL